MLWGIKGTVIKRNSEHIHDMHELLVCLNSGGEQWINGQCYPFAEGRVFFLASGTSHAIIASEDSPANYIFFCFDQLHFLNNNQPAIHQVLRDMDKNKTYASSVNPEYLKQNIPLFEEMYDELTRPLPLAKERLHALLTNAIIKYYRFSCVINDEKNDDTTGKLEKLCQKIAKAQTDLALIEAAKYVSMGKTQFTQRFKQFTGMTYVEYVQWTKIKRAVDLFLASDYSVSEVAEHAGLQNLGYFHRLFKKYTSMTPLAFKKYVKEKGAIPKILTEFNPMDIRS